MKRLLAIAASSLLILTGCASEPEFGEVSSAIQDSQEMQEENSAEATPEPRETSDLDPDALARLQEIEDDRQEFEDSQAAEKASNLALQTSITAVEDAQLLLDGELRDVSSFLLAGPATDPAIIQQTSEYLANAISMWDDKYGVIENYQLVMFRPEDAGWADETRAGFGDRVYFGTFQNGVEINGDFCGFALAVETRIYMCIPESNDILHFRSVVPHEYFHLIQIQMGISTQLPIWLFEGFATFFGDVAGGRSPQSIIDGKGNLRNGAMATYFGAPALSQYVDDITETKFIALFEALEARPVNNAPALIEKYSAYLWGFLAAQYLVGTYGVDQVLEYQENVGAGQDWRAAFLASFELSPKEFYPKLLEHIKELYSN